MPGSLNFGDFLYYIGFQVEYTFVRLVRGLAFLIGGLARALAALLFILLRPAVQTAGSFCAALRHPRQLASWLVPGVCAVLLALHIHGVLTQPYILQVEVNGQSVGYVAEEQDFDAARADVQARLHAAGTSVDWELSPAYTLVMGSRHTPVMTEREIADAILRASGGEITEGTAVYIDGSLRLVLREGDHLRSYLQTVLDPWRVPGRTTSFAHALRLVDGIYPAGSIRPYSEAIQTLQADGSALLQVQSRGYETTEQPVPYETQTVEDPDLDFGRTETVQAGQEGVEQVTRELTYLDGTLTDSQVVDVQLLQAPVPEIQHRGTRLRSGMIGRLGTGSFIWPVPGYSGISRWANLPYGHRGVDITAPYGTPIYAADSGTVIAAQWHNHPTASWGYYVEIDHGNGYKTLYAHMSSFVVQAGETVTKGQLIGYVGATGYATGNHCHFEMYYNNTLISARNVFPDL